MIQPIQINATEIVLHNKVAATENITVDAKWSFRVNYSETGDSCRAILNIGISNPEAPEKLTISCTINGEYSITNVQNENGKKRTHVECYHALFPYAQSLLARLCIDAGLPAFYFKEDQIKEDDVVIEK